MATTDDFHREHFDFECGECGATECVDDHASGDRVCTSCGLVAEAHAIDEHSEWRTFADSDKPGTDMNRVGGPVNHLLSDGGIGSTVIGKASKGDAGGLVQTLQRIGNTAGADRAMVSASGTIAKICDRLGLPKAIKDYACELFKRAMDQGLVKGRSQCANCAAAIMLASRQEKVSRSFDEVAKVADNCNKKAIAKAFKAMLSNVMKPGEMTKTASHPTEYMIRWSNKLGMGAKHAKACQDLIETIIPKPGTERTGSLAVLKSWDGRSPNTLAGAVLYIICNLFLVTKKSDVQVPLSDICNVVKVGASTIKATVTQLQPDYDDLLPKWIGATQQQIATMIAEGYPGSSEPAPVS
ncbi:hypothetical protein WJX74_002568 [Apatococcus lobatus]|uniref:General transcription factor TFIIB n=1 Tax=Apatococcus lobatus TaxID=904363 RepID=A0AAW1R366_9CHLO